MAHSHDIEGILLEPDSSKGEIGVLNPAVPELEGYRKPFLYRAIKEDLMGGFSTIDLRFLKNPTTLSDESRTIIRPSSTYDGAGCEDPRISIVDGDYWITYVGFNGVNATVLLDIMDKEFNLIRKVGPVGPRIPLEEAIEIVSCDECKTVWKRQYEEAKKVVTSPNRFGERLLLWNKDACIQKVNGDFIFLYRLDPNMQATAFSSLDELQDQDRWREILGDLEKHTFLGVKDLGEEWSQLKIGWGTGLVNANKRLIALVHGVEQTHEHETHGRNHHVYKGTFIEADSTNPVKALAVIRDPLHVPRNKKIHRMHDSAGGVEESKDVIFPTALVVEGDTLYCYSGLADERIGYRSTDKEWVLGKLTQADNLIPQR